MFHQIIHHPLDVIHQLLNKFHLFATKVTNNGEDTSFNIQSKGYIAAYLKFKLSAYRSCAMTTFIHHPTDVFPHLIHNPLEASLQFLNMFHLIKFTVKPRTKVHTTVLAHYHMFLYSSFMFAHR